MTFQLFKSAERFYAEWLRTGEGEGTVEEMVGNMMRYMSLEGTREITTGDWEAVGFPGGKDEALRVGHEARQRLAVGNVARADDPFLREPS